MNPPANTLCIQTGYPKNWMYAILDVDHPEAMKLPLVKSLLSWGCPYILSRTKRLPHFFVRVKTSDLGEKIQCTYSYRENGVGYLDLLTGTWAWDGLSEVDPGGLADDLQQENTDSST